MRQHMPVARLAPALAFLLVAGCSGESRLPTAVSLPTRDGSVADSAQSTAEIQLVARGTFYPLNIGNRWRYEGTSTTRQGDVVKHGRWARQTVLTQSVTRYGRTYVEEQGTVTQPNQEFQVVRWLRQDRSGLFEAGVPPPGAPPGYEMRLLAYPLHREARWLMSETPRITAEVAGMEVRATPAGRFPAWRLRLRYAGRDPREQLFVWYGRVGYLGMTRHLRFERPGPDGAPITIVEDEAEWLTALDLTRREAEAPR
jgi:hypothetical protein